MSDILSQDEVNALLRGVADGAVPAGDEPSGVRGGVRTLDLTNQEVTLRGRLPGLERVADRFARNLRRALAALFGQMPEVRVSALELERLGTFTSRLPQPISLQLFRLAPLRGQGMLVVHPALAAGLLEALFGGSAARPTPLAARDFSAIEQRVLERLGAQVLRAFAEAWRPVEAVECSFVRSETNPQYATIVGTQDLVVRLDVDVVLDAREDGRLSLCFPNAALDPVRARLRRVQANGEESGAAEPSWAERLRAALADAECEVSAELGSHLMSLRDVLALKTGDLIPLRTGREGPIVVRVAGRARFLGAPGVAGGSNAVRVTGRI